MANYIDATVTFYGYEQNVEEIISAIGLDIDTTYSEDNITEGFVQLKWNLNPLVSPKMVDLCMKHRVTLKAYGYEPGVDFAQCVGINQEGVVFNKELSMPSVDPDPEWMEGK